MKMDWDLPEIDLNNRISMHYICMKLAMLLSLRSSCPRGQVGVVIENNSRIISTGYVGSMPGEPHCFDIGCNINEQTGSCERTIHGEMNAIMYAVSKQINLVGSSLYTTLSPCLNCAKLIVHSHIAVVWYLKEYRDTKPIKYLQDHNVMCYLFSTEGNINE